MIVGFVAFGCLASGHCVVVVAAIVLVHQFDRRRRASQRVVCVAAIVGVVRRANVHLQSARVAVVALIVAIVAIALRMLGLDVRGRSSVAGTQLVDGGRNIVSFGIFHTLGGDRINVFGTRALDCHFHVLVVAEARRLRIRAGRRDDHLFADVHQHGGRFQVLL